MSGQAWIALVVGCAAVIDDLARRRISNWIPLLAFFSGLGLQTVERGWRGSVAALAGTLAGGAAFLIFYLLGGMGGGDIKLLAGFGAVLGAGRVLEAALWAAGCGGLIAAGVIAVSAVRRRWSFVPGPGQPAGVKGPAPVEGESIPYAPAIALGVWLSLAAKASGATA